ncbi:testis-expressed protein 9 isoform X1 [Callorhinchus milii]|uniref:Testis expressed 9 n=3 Tax=Callorhinchus milii TaxID=7868 RepID=A0A4W3GQJ2_CALMI|nr:testis-expressed protein 9 isoform X1 [Callorhinchus milii]|eukprot:gi/632938384/ref/XP_007904753.1/ PREDICTED: testis-expressed sequence 9 protein [Callorhinchus milii]
MSAGRRLAASQVKDFVPARSNIHPSSAPAMKQRPRDLLAKEEEYKRLNAELEAKTAELVRQAEEVMKGQEKMLSKPVSSHIGTDILEDDEKLREFLSSDVTSLESKVSKNKNKVGLKATQHSRPCSANKGKKVTNVKHKATELHAADDVAVPADNSDFSLVKIIHEIEGKLEDGSLVEVEDDVMPSACNEMGTEAQIRFLKAKLRVMQEELDKLVHEYNKKDDENTTLSNRLKDTEDERSRLQKTAGIQQTQIEKYKHLADEAHQKSDGLQQQLSSLQKDLESLKRSQRQNITNQNATEVRLNRALEEVEKYKTELNKLKQGNKDTANQDRGKIEQLKTENKRLEKQKAELMTGFKKQLKLIDILKRQKMHIEAAKMLSFTEEEFIKALEWGN